jgi:hypothetical protein
LWATVSRAGMLGRSCSPNTLTMTLNKRNIALGRVAGIQQMLWRSRELADELRFWLAPLRAGREL